MNLVAIHGLKPDKESLANTLASVLGVTIYEALSRLRSPGNGPFTVTVFAEEKIAVQLAERLLARAGQAALLGSSLVPEKHLSVAPPCLQKCSGAKPED